MFYTEAYKERQSLEVGLKNKWAKALNANGGIENEHLARSTAILCENYLSELKNDPRLIAEDRVQSGAFRGVNLALLGLITRVIPNLVGAELVGVQAMPTPKSPIFTMTWHRSTTKGLTTGNTNAGKFPGLPDGDELWVTPISDNVEFGGVDPYYTSNQVNEVKTRTTLAGEDDYEFVWADALKKETQNGADNPGYLLPETVVIYFLDAAADITDFQTYGDATNYLGRAYITGATNGTGNYLMAVADKNGDAITITEVITFEQDSSKNKNNFSW